jgi:cellobiose-specific phosphotransferase system component IIB
VKRLDVFLQMEADLVEFEIKIPSHPTTNSKSDREALLKDYKESKDELVKFEKDLDAKMHDKTGKVALFNNIIVDHHGPYDWRKSKNPARDFPRFILAAFVEPRLITAYRPRLIQKSSAAAFLRDSVQKLLSSYAKPCQVIKSGSRKTATVRAYKFPHGIEARPVNIPEVDVNAILTNISDNEHTREQLNTIKALIKKVESLPCAIARPDVPLLAPQIKELIQELSDVSCSLH